MVLKQFSYDVGYPVYGAKFLNEKTLLIAGGGGEGNNGIPNKLTALKVDFSRPKALKKYRELSLLDNEDSPMSLDCNNGVIVLGVNQNSEAIKQGENRHFRKFVYQNEHLKPVGAVQISGSKIPTEYQKLTVLTPDGAIAVISVSTEPSSVYVVDTEDMDCQYEIKASGDVKDISISPDGKVACYITASTLETVSTVTGKPIIKHSSFKDFTLGKISFLDSETILISGVMKQGGGVVLAEFSIPKKTVTKSKVVAKKLKGVTSMDVSHGLVALAGSDTSVTIVKTSNLKTVVTLPQVHNFAITKIAFSPDGSYLASVSAANTVNIIQIPPTLATAKSKTSSFFHFLFMSVLVVLLSIFAQWFYSSGLAATTYRHAVDLINKKPQDSSPYFKVEPIDENETFVKVPTSYTTTSSVSEEVFTILPVGEPDVKLNREEPEQVASILPVGEPDVQLNKDDPEQVASILPVGEPDVKIDKGESDKIFSIQPVGEPIVHADEKDEYVEKTQISSVAASESRSEEPITNTIDTELTEASPTETTEEISTSDVAAETFTAATELGSKTEEEIDSDSVSDSVSNVETEPETESSAANVETDTDSETHFVSESETESELESEVEISSVIDTETESEPESNVDTSIVTESEVDSIAESSVVLETVTEAGSETESETPIVSDTETEVEQEMESEPETPVDTETDVEQEIESEPETPVFFDTETEVEQGIESEETDAIPLTEKPTEIESETAMVAETSVDSKKEFAPIATDSPVSSETESDFSSSTDVEALSSDDEAADISSWAAEAEPTEIVEEPVTTTEASSIETIENSSEEHVEITETSFEKPTDSETTPSHAHPTKSESFSLTSASESTQELQEEVEEVTVQVTLTSTLTQTVLEKDETEATELVSQSKPVETVAVTVAVTATATVVETVFQTVVETVTEKVVETGLVHDDL